MQKFEKKCVWFLEGKVLDYAVAIANGEETMMYNIYGHLVPMFIPRYSTVWALGGLIIQREEINLYAPGSDYFWEAQIKPMVSPARQEGKGAGETPLEAAMRAFVHSKLGEEIEIPSELLEVSK